MRDYRFLPSLQNVLFRYLLYSHRVVCARNSENKGIFTSVKQRYLFIGSL